MFFLQINEFNPALMAMAANELGAKNIKCLLSMRHTQTETEDKEERFGLDPWVQWVSIHTGKRSIEHGVEHLGDVPQLRFPQIWEVLDRQGVRTGIWGCMNASRGRVENNAFFFPDPWTFTEKAHPTELNDFLALPRYYAKNYGALNKWKVALNLLRLARFCIRPRIAFALLPLAPKVLRLVKRHGMPDYLLFGLFDLINAKLFVHYQSRKNTGFSLFFLNSIAHLQHHKWTREDRLSEEMRLVFTLFDDLLGILFSGLGEDKQWLAANAFSQKCSHTQNEYLYRQFSPAGFLQTAGISFLSVEQAMTNDGHVFFESAASAKLAASLLSAATVEGLTAFHVDYNEKTPEKLFFQFAVWAMLPDDAKMQINDRSLLFYEQFERVTRRTGSHISRGDVFSQDINIPDMIENHKIYNYIIQSYTNQPRPLPNALT